MEKIIKFDDTEIQKQKFHQHKRPISIKTRSTTAVDSRHLNVKE